MKTILLAISLLCLMNACARSQSSNDPIILVAFGTSYASGQADLEAIDTAVCAAYPGRDIRWAFTSDVIVEKLRKKNVSTLFARKVPLAYLPEVLTTLQQQGHKAVIIQSLHICLGEEWTNMRATPLPTGMQARWGEPLLTDQASTTALLDVLAPRLTAPDTASVLVVHGNDKYPQYNAQNLALDAAARARFPHVLAASVEGKPGTDGPLAEVLTWKCTKVRFIPCMLVAGDHTTNDVMGDEADSWKSRLKLPATCDKGLGSDPGVAQLFLRRIEGAKP